MEDGDRRVDRDIDRLIAQQDLAREMVRVEPAPERRNEEVEMEDGEEVGMAEDGEDKDEIMEEGEIMRLAHSGELGGSLMRLSSQAGERRKSWKDDVDKMEEVLGKEGTHGALIEIYSPPRMNAVAAMWGLLPGWSLDFTINDPDDGMPWDINIQE